MGSEGGALVVVGIIVAAGIIFVAMNPAILENLGIGIGKPIPGPTTPVPETPETPPKEDEDDEQKNKEEKDKKEKEDKEKGKRGRGWPWVYPIPVPVPVPRPVPPSTKGAVIHTNPAGSAYQNTYVRITGDGFRPNEMVNFYFGIRSMLLAGGYSIGTVTPGGEIQHAVDRADMRGRAEVKMIMPSSIAGWADVSGVGQVSGRTANGSIYVVSTTKPKPIKSFTIEVQGERFYLQAKDPHVIQGLMNMYHGKPSLAHFHGKLKLGNGGFNSPWSWHLEPSSLTLSEASVTTCSMKPSYVETNLTTVIKNVGFLCGPNAKVIAINYI